MVKIERNGKANNFIIGHIIFHFSYDTLIGLTIKDKVLLKEAENPNERSRTTMKHIRAFYDESKELNVEVPAQEFHEVIKNLKKQMLFQIF